MYKMLIDDKNRMKKDEVIHTTRVFLRGHHDTLDKNYALHITNDPHSHDERHDDISIYVRAALM